MTKEDNFNFLMLLIEKIRYKQNKKRKHYIFDV